MIISSHATRRTVCLSAFTAILIGMMSMFFIPLSHSVPPPNWNAPMGSPISDAPVNNLDSVSMQEDEHCSLTSDQNPRMTSRILPELESLHVDDLHRMLDHDGHSLVGRGQRIAVIDTGVNPNVRFGNRLSAGGDYVAGGNGLRDCDHHGTLVAGIIAASPSNSDHFVGVAPGATIVSIRQTSVHYQPNTFEHVDRKKSIINNPVTLAKAIDHAVTLRATIINISVTVCAPAEQHHNANVLRDALWNAYKHNIVVISSAGNLSDPDCGGVNPGFDPNNPADERNWNGVVTYAYPAYFTPVVLSVGGIEANGNIYTGTAGGPWIGVGAPASNIVSLCPDMGATGGLCDSYVNVKKSNSSSGLGGETKSYVSISGTSFSAAFVTGIAALIRQLHPEWSAHQVMQRIIDTAIKPDIVSASFVGAGAVDALAAVTSDMPPAPVNSAITPAVFVAPPPAPTPPDRIAQNDAIIAALVGLGAIGAFMAVNFMRYHRKNIALEK